MSRHVSQLLAQPQWTSLREDLQSLNHGSSAWIPYWENTLRKYERVRSLCPWLQWPFYSEMDL